MQINDLSPDLLCPPETTGETQELILQMLCVIFAFLIVVVLTKFTWDYYIYRTRGQLPWIVLKMP